MPSLQTLIDDSEFEVIAVITQEDKKVGRKQEITPPPVKLLAMKYGIPVFQPPKVRGNSEFLDIIRQLKPDIFVVVAYGQILPQEFLDIPRFGAVNVHASLLPKYRGASPIEAALLHGDPQTGITIMKMAKKLDAGDILDVARLPIESTDTTDTLTIKLSLLGGKILPYVLKDVRDDHVTPLPQNESKATFCHKLEKNDGLIDLKALTAVEVFNRVRAYASWPSAFLMIDEKRFKLLEIETDESSHLKPGEVKEITKTSLAIGTVQGAIIPKKVQLEGKKPMTIHEFLAGNRSFFSKLLTNPK